MQLFKSQGRISFGWLLLLAGAAGLLLWAWGALVVELAGLVFGGGVLAFLLLPLCRLLEKKLSGPLSALLTLALTLSALAGLIALLLPALVRQFSALSGLIPDAFARLGNLFNAFKDFLQARLPGIALPDLRLSGSEDGVARFASGAVNYVSGFTGGIYRWTLMVVLSYFLLVDRQKLQLRAELLIPCRMRCLAVRAGSILTRELRLYLRGQATIAVAVGVLAGTLLLLAGVPGAPLMGVFVGIFNIIPYFGPVIGGIPAMLMALSVSWQKALLCLAVLFVVQQIDGLVISPRVMGNVTGFSPAVVLLALFAGGNVGGIAGMLLALPVLMAFRTLYRIYVQRNEKN